MVFIVKKGVDLKKYGFVQRTDKPTSWYWWRKGRFGRGGMNMHYYEQDRRISIASASSDCIAVLCQMYKDGNLEIHNDNNFYKMNLTEEEVNIIVERRAKNEN